MFKKIYVEITNSCNKNCSFCSISKRKKKEMSLSEFKEVIEKIKPYTNYIYLHIKGEPLLHSNIKDILEICRVNKIKVNLTTNGTYLNKYKEVICDSNIVRQINISLHSYKKDDDFKTLFETVDYINKNSKIYLVYRYWILSKTNKSNNYQINKLIDYYKLDDNIKDKIYHKLNIKINDTLYVNKDYEFIWPSLDNNCHNLTGTCLGLKSHIGILSDGTVVPCCLDAEGIIALGNIFEKSLDEILNSERAQKMIKGFRENKKIEELCKHCSFKK